VSLSIGGSKGKNKGTSSIDNPSIEYQNQIRNAAMGAGASGPSPLVGGATDYYKQMMAGGNMGMGAMSGDPNATAALMNPYQQQVINATNQQWDQNDQHTMNAVNDRATQAGAFGGSRQGVATGTALAQNNMNRNQAVSGLLYGGFNDTMGRAQNMAQMGAYGAGQNANLGMGGVGNQQQWLMNMLNQGYRGPYGGAQNGSGYSMSGSASQTGGK
jgi:hypothetical protein